MPVDENLLLFSLANTFNTTFKINICADTKAFIKATGKKFDKLPNSEKVYYVKYSIKLAESLSDYLDDIKLFEINTDPDHDIVHDFRLTWAKKNVAHISMSHKTINVKDVIPEKLMKICKYKRNTKICKAYTEKYKKINSNGYKKIKSKNKYSELSDKSKNSNLLGPICDLVLNTLSKKRKCASNFYDFLFAESDRLVLKLYKSRFTIYDFGKELVDVESFGMKLNPGNELLITFNNGVKFSLVLQTNASEIKEHLSLKFHTKIKNLDDLFGVANASI